MVDIDLQKVLSRAIDVVIWLIGFGAVAIMLLAAWAVLAHADTGCEHQLAHDRPIPFGVSGSNISDECVSGTLGSLVEDLEGTRYVLSNAHVLSRVDQGVSGELIVQPGLRDQQCVRDEDMTVARLTRFARIDFAEGRFNVVDAAIATVAPGQVMPDGFILDVGVPAPTTTAATVGMTVVKSGRTTGYTTGVVEATDVTAGVTYPDGRVALFINQIMIGNETFGAPGDSGSLIVTPGDPPSAVGLLFAGSPTFTLANPIDPVLQALCVGFPSGAGPAVPDPDACVCQPLPGGNTANDALVFEAPPTRGAALAARTLAVELVTRHDEVVGTGVRGGRIQVYVTGHRKRWKNKLPRRMRGWPLRVVKTGEFRAYGPLPTQPRPPRFKQLICANPACSVRYALDARGGVWVWVMENDAFEGYWRQVEPTRVPFEGREEDR